MQLVSVAHSSSGKTLTLNFEKLDAAVAKRLKQEMLSSIQGETVGTLTVDMCNVSFIDSSGLGALVSVRKHLPAEATMRIENTNDFIGKVLVLTKMDRVFSF